MVNVEIVFVDSEKSVFHEFLKVKAGSCIREALAESKLYEDHPEARDLPIGIFSKSVGLDQVLREGDRVEIYRPLLLDPKENRRQKAKTRK